MPFQSAFAGLSKLGCFSDFTEATLSVTLFIVAGPIPPLRFAVTPQGPACGTPATCWSLCYAFMAAA